MKFNHILVCYLFAFVLPGFSFSTEVVYEEVEQKAIQLDFSGVVMHWKDGNVIYAKAFGEANRECKTANTITTQFNLASVNKLFTKILITQLIQQGELQLDTKIGQVIPELQSTDKAQITIQQLLTMSSGLGDYLQNPEYADHKTRYVDQESFLPLIQIAPLEFTPGEGRSYSNLGFELLGLVVARLHNSCYRSVLEAAIFQKAGMNASGFFTKSDYHAGMAVGYTQTVDSKESSVPNWDAKSHIGTAAGGGYSTCHDMVKLGEALLNLELLDSKHLQLILSDFSESHKKPHLFIGGGGPGINTSFYLNIPKREVIVILANQDPPAASEINNVFYNASKAKKQF